MTLAKRLLSRIPAKSLLIADRCYGVGAFLNEFLTVLQDASCAYLVRVRRAKGAWVDVRFWTNLLDSKSYPAGELLALYAKRWEQVMMYKQLKIDMRQAPLLNSHTPHTAAQEVASLVLAHALIAQTRMQAAGVAGTEVLRISFGKTLVLVRSLWLTLAAGHGIITKKQAQALTDQMLNFLSDTLLPLRRQRSCPRKV